MPVPSSKPLLLVGAGDGPTYREFSLARIAASHPVVLIDTALPAWARPYVAEHVAADLTDLTAVAAAAKDFACHHSLAGVLSYMEHHVVTAAHLAEDLALPGAHPEAMAHCRDKAATRRLLAAHDVPSARSEQAADADAAVAHAQAIGYPVVVKPRAMAGSAGVVLAGDNSQVRAAFARAQRETVLGLDRFAQPGVLVEEYLDGPEISVETVVLGPGEIQVVAITRKTLGPPPTFQEYGHSVDAADELLHDPALADVVSAAVHALRLTLGVLHVEIRLTARGPRIVEINGRLGGDLIPLLVHRATGIDLPQAAAALATGSRPALTPRRHQAAAIRFIYPALSGRVEHLTIPSSAITRPPVERFVFTQEPGAHVTAPPHAAISDRIAHCVVTGTDTTDCHRALDRVERQLRIHLQPPLLTTSCTR
ncbi:ATP-grasp domain-containing protein [Streptomyces sp. NPDC002952]|uniref:ATP-grasp domain-containing protein n=1 Tax=Streptomyces sp. NPDC002952 TaxID=3364673 RepID=UPI0036B89547